MRTLASIFCILFGLLAPTAHAQLGPLEAPIIFAATNPNTVETATATSSTPPSHFYCGNVNKAVVGAGGCDSYATDEKGRLPAFERPEIRGWIVAAPAWSDDDEVAMNVLLDWGWQPLASGVRALNTPEAVVNAITPANVIVFGRNPADYTALSSRLSPANSRQAWGGPFAAVVHVELQAWRLRLGSIPAPSDWFTRRRHPESDNEHLFAFDPIRPAAEPALERDLKVGDYVRI